MTVAESREFNQIEKYNLMKNPASKSLKEVPTGETIKVKDWIIFESQKKDDKGEEKTETLISLLTLDGNVYVSNSETFGRDFLDARDVCIGFPYIPVIKLDGVAKSGRSFIYCTLNIEEATKLMNECE